MAADIITALRAAALAPAKDLALQPDGRLVRFRVEGDKPGSRNGWVVWHGAFGAFGSWKTGATHTWCEATARPQTPAERAAMQRAIQATRETRAAEERVVQAAARDRAAKLLSRAHPAHDGHPYLRAKRVQAVDGLAELRDMLVVPARDAAGVLHTLQFISADGSKRFLSGGRIRGCYFAIGRPRRMLLLAEGLATACTLHQATGEAVAVAFNCGNLEAVARALRAKFAALRIVVCADNDWQTPGNPGLSHARAAARAVGGFVAAPRFDGVAA